MKNNVGISQFDYNLNIYEDLSNIEALNIDEKNNNFNI